MTLDGQLAAADKTSQWITCPEARKDAHRLRAQVDAIMVGAGTLRADNPRLTARLDGDREPGSRQPVPVVVAGVGDLPSEARVFERDAIILSPSALDVPGRVIQVPDVSGARVDLAAGLDHLGALGIGQVMVEGGAALFRSLIDSGSVDRVVLYYGPMLAGGIGVPLASGAWETLDEARRGRITAIERLGESVRIDFTLGGC